MESAWFLLFALWDPGHAIAVLILLALQSLVAPRFSAEQRELHCLSPNDASLPFLGIV